MIPIRFIECAFGNHGDAFNGTVRGIREGTILCLFTDRVALKRHLTKLTFSLEQITLNCDANDFSI